VLQGRDGQLGPAQQHISAVGVDAPLASAGER
jgi:hypothetical protein